MPEDLGYLLQWNTDADHLACHGVAQAVCANRGNAGPLAGAVNDLRHGCASQAGKWRLCRQEDLSQGGPGTPATKVGNDRLAHVCRQRETVLTLTFAVDGDLRAVPFDVVELKDCDFACAEPKTQEHHQDRVVSLPRSGTAVTGSENRLAVGSADPSRQHRLTSSCGAKRGARQICPDQSFGVTEPEERTQCGHEILRGSDRDPRDSARIARVTSEAVKLASSRSTPQLARNRLTLAAYATTVGNCSPRTSTR